MTLSFGELSMLEKVLTLFALTGGGLFVVKSVLQLVGAGGDDGDVPDDVDVDDSAESFKFLSLHSLSAFAMMFGLVGLACLKSGFPAFLAIIGGLIGGGLAGWIMARIFRIMAGFQSQGNVDIQNAIGEEGTVYLHIPEDGIGKVQVVIQSRLMVRDAASRSKKEIPTGARILVVNVTEENLLIVDPI